MLRTLVQVKVGRHGVRVLAKLSVKNQSLELNLLRPAKDLICQDIEIAWLTIRKRNLAAGSPGHGASPSTTKPFVLLN
jgi:hypothetical protein